MAFGSSFSGSYVPLGDAARHPCAMKNRDIYWRRYKKHCTQDNDTSVPFKAGTLGPHTVLLASLHCSKHSAKSFVGISYPLYFHESHWQSEISSLSKVILVFGKARSHGVPNLGCVGTESPGWFAVLPKNCMRHEQACCHDGAANHQLLITLASWIIQIVSTEECSSLMQNLMQILCSTCSVIFNVTATQYTCSFNSVYCPHWLIQWSHHCSHMCIPVHCPWLRGYIDVVQTILVILTMAGLFLDRTCIYIYIKPNMSSYWCLQLQCRNIYTIQWE